MMGQKVNPIGFRTGIMVGWKSRWYASKQDFAALLIEDHKIRQFIKNHPKNRSIATRESTKIEIERTRDEVKVVLHVGPAGLIIGEKGQEVELLQDELQDLIGRRVNLKIEEISPSGDCRPSSWPRTSPSSLAKRASFRRDDEADDGTDDGGRAPRVSRFNWPAGSAAPKWPAGKNRLPGRFR